MPTGGLQLPLKSKLSGNLVDRDNDGEPTYLMTLLDDRSRYLLCCTAR